MVNLIVGWLSSTFICLLYLNNQSTVSTAKRLASDTINGYEFACIWNSKYNEHVFMIQTNADFIFKTYGFCLLLTLNCKHLAEQLLPLAMFYRIDICPSCFVYDLSNTIFRPIGIALTKHPVASQIWTHNSKRLAYTLTA